MSADEFTKLWKSNWKNPKVKVLASVIKSFKDLKKSAENFDGTSKKRYLELKGMILEKDEKIDKIKRGNASEEKGSSTYEIKFLL